MIQRILKRIRSEEDKETRRRWGDRSGRCRFSKTLAMGVEVSNTISTVWKDNLIVEY